MGSGRREYQLHVPPRYDPRTPAPLVLNLHGAAGNARWQMRQTNMNQLSDREGFLIVYPEGTPGQVSSARTWNAGRCCGRAHEKGVDDVAAIAAILDDVSSRYCVDPDRVYAAGMSNGGMMVLRLACELSSRLAAVASVAGALVVDRCAPSRPVSVMLVHGSADAVVPPAGGASRSPITAGMIFEPVRRLAETWAARDGCTGATTDDGGAASCETWQPCRGNAAVRLCIVKGSRHVWPGSLRDRGAAFAASEEIWRFFQAHPASGAG